ncbi:MAG TPA: DUF3662 and FHA domain-containing protein [Miltoncostaeales bacterium]|jgi:hypothetical protein|nr:DUF3662 and FHA domain-containing protein [Miltoncostaeales bacterium]
MSTLRNAEGAISGFFDRIFGRVFRGYVEPVELARKLAREMEDHKTVSVSRVYVPNEYVIYLSEGDFGRFSSFQGSLTQELGIYLAERARHEGFTLLSDPLIRIEVDQDLVLGAYGIACRVVDLPADGTEPAIAAHDDEPPAPATTVRPAGTRDDPFSPFVPASPPPAPSIPVDLDEPAGPAAFVDDVDAEEPDIDVDELVGDGLEDDLDDDLDDEDPFDELPDGGDNEDDASVGAASVDLFAPLAPLDEDPDQADWPKVPIIPGAPEPVPAAALKPPPPMPEPAPPAAFVPPPPTPEPVPPHRPLPEPGGYEPLAGVSGTQIFPSQPEAAMVHEEVSLIVSGRRVRLTRRTSTLGRSRDCDIPISDPNASRQHAEIRHIGLDYFLVDQNSTNGTYVNGQRIRRHALADGDRITIGTTEMIVEHITVERG